MNQSAPPLPISTSPSRSGRGRPARKSALPVRDHVAIAQQFEVAVLAGHFPCGKLFKAAVERQVRERENPPKGYQFDPDLGAKACRFAEQLPIGKGPKRGQPFVLESWEVWLLVALFGWVDPVTGYCRFRRASVWLPKGNGKSPLAAIIVLYVLATSRECPECYGAATAQKQARLVFAHAQEMLRLAPKVQERFGLRVEEHKIRGVCDNRVYEPVSAEAKSNEGLRPNVVVLDECHVLSDRKLFDNLESTCTKVDGSLFVIISTAGFNSSEDAIGWQEYCRARDVLEQKSAEPTLFALIASADEGSDPWTEATWRQANPNLGVSVSLVGLRAAAEYAQKHKSAQPNFLTKHLNWWCQSNEQWMDMGAWDACADASLKREDFAGKPCVVGLDLATRRAFCAKVLLFPEQRADGIHVTAFADHYLHQTATEELDPALQPYVTTNPGEVTDLDQVTDSVIDDKDKFQIPEICLDRYFAQQMTQRFEGAGLVVVEIPQTTPHLSPAMKEVEALVLSGRFHHDGNPLFRDCVQNVIAHEDANGNVFPNHAEGKRIDSASALFDAVLRAEANAGTAADDGGVWSF